jgi:phage-related protein
LTFDLTQEIFITMMMLVTKILGEVDIWSLFNLFMQLLPPVTQCVLAIVQALAAVAPSVLNFLSLILNIIIVQLLEVVKLLLPIVIFLFRILAIILPPILYVIVHIVNWYARRRTRLVRLTHCLPA